MAIINNLVVLLGCMKKLHATLLAVLMATISLAGCFGNESDGGEKEEQNEVLEDWSVYYVDTADKLPDCDSDALGMLYYVGSSQSFEVCLSSGWSFIDLKGNDGEIGPAGQDANETRLNDLTTRVDQFQAELMALDSMDEDFSTRLDSLVDEVNSLQSQIDNLEHNSPVWMTEIQDGDCGQDGWGSEILSGYDSSNDGRLSDEEAESSIEICTEVAHNPYTLTNTGSPANGLITSYEEDLVFGSENCLVRYDFKEDSITNLICLNEPVEPLRYDYVPRQSTNDLLFFVLDTSIEGRELWVTDGTSSGTYLVRDINPNTSGVIDGLRGFNALRDGNFAVLDEALYFMANDGSNGTELWRSDGTESGTHIISDTTNGNHSWSSYLTPYNDNLLFINIDSMNDKFLYVMNGNDFSVSVLKEMSASYLIEFNNKVYFSGKDSQSTTGYELWITDGTPAGTNMVSDIFPGSGHGSPSQFLASDNYLWFLANNSQGTYVHSLDNMGNIKVYSNQESEYYYPIHLSWVDEVYDHLYLIKYSRITQLNPSGGSLTHYYISEDPDLGYSMDYIGETQGQTYFSHFARVDDALGNLIFSYLDYSPIETNCGSIIRSSYGAHVNEDGLFLPLGDDCRYGDHSNIEQSYLYTTAYLETTVRYS